MTITLSATARRILDELEEGRVRRETAQAFTLMCDNTGDVRAREISTPDAKSHRLNAASANPADPREGRGVVIRGSDE
jgi:hypothetical protein